MYEKADAFAATLKCLVIKETNSKELMDDVEEDYIVDEKARSSVLTKHGVEKAEKWFGVENLSDPENSELSHHINQAIKARGIMKKDIDYVVKDGEVIIVDEFTGRLMFGRRYNEGLHQAIEAKERVKIEKESMTQATITFQNFFRMYHKLSGMTGTALTEEGEFNGIYSLDVVAVPTNKAVARIDQPDAVYKTVAGKYKALVQVKPVKVYRDNNKDDVYDMIPQQIDEGCFGINIHRSNPYTKSKLVNDWSAGCQVFADPDAFRCFMKLCEEQKKRFGNNFTYTLLDEKDFD
jgi:preprotein translocase subunit SecA